MANHPEQNPAHPLLLTKKNQLTCLRYSLMLTNPSTTPLVPLASPPATSMLYTSSTCTCVQQYNEKRPQQQRPHAHAETTLSAWAGARERRLMTSTAGLHLL